jgi:hypothetical protein
MIVHTGPNSCSGTYTPQETMEPVGGQVGLGRNFGPGVAA